MGENYITERIRRTRKIRSISQAEIAKKMGISQPQYSRIENNPNLMRLSGLLEIAEILGVSLQYLTDNGENWQYYVQYTSQTEEQHKARIKWLSESLEKERRRYNERLNDKDKLYDLVSDDLKKANDENYKLRAEMTSATGNKDKIISELQRKLRKSITISYQTKNSLNDLLNFFSVNTFSESSQFAQHKNSWDLNALGQFLSPIRREIRSWITVVSDTIEELKVYQDQ